MSLSVEVLNTIRNNADSEYQSRIPVATQNNIAEIGRAFETYDVEYNHFVTTLMHKIGKTTVETALFNNKLKSFKSGSLLSMQDIEEIFVEAFRVAEGTYDREGGVGEGGVNPFKRREYQDTKVVYHRMNRQDKYVITLYKDDVIKAFTSATKLDEFISAQFNSLYSGAEWDEFTHMKQLLAEGIKAGDFFDYTVPAIGTANQTDAQLQKACKDFVRTVKKAIKDVEYPSTNFNPAGVKTLTKKSNLVLFINKDVPAHLDVDLYSSIFGPGYADLGIEIVELDNFGADDNGTYALLCDKEWFKVYDTKNEMRQLENPDGLYTNYWLHIWQVLSYSKFKTAIRFGTTAIVKGA
ncbi:MAG: hypothetical protein J6R88_01475 [Clostridia bacterium]|nr:hypothetical protein [Clostridia bacterium]